ncbi:hypothetical protein ACWDTI_16470 [Gordonia sp. NPDC003424]
MTNTRWDRSYGINFYTGGLWKNTPFGALQDADMYWVGDRVNSTFDKSSRHWPGQFMDDEVDGRFDPAAGLKHLADLRSELADRRQFLYTNFTRMVVGPDLPEDVKERYVNTFADVVSLDMYAYTIPFCNDPADTYRGTMFDVPIPLQTCRSSATYGRMTAALRANDALDGKLVPIWNFIDLYGGADNDGNFIRYIRPDELRGAAMASVINEARGIVWFQQSFGGPCKSSQPLRDAQRQGAAFCGNDQLLALREINALLRKMAPVLNTQSYRWSAGSHVQTMLKVKDGKAYLFAMTDGGSGIRTFTVPEGLSGKAEVIGEGRQISINDRHFSDMFATESTYHLYEISLSS